MEDLRYKQIQEETQLETDTTGSLYAFSGFGRSTESIEKKDKVQVLGQKRLAVLSQLISLEEQAKAGAGVLDAITAKEYELQQLSAEAQ